MIRTEVAIDGAAYLLAQGQDVGELRQRIEDAVHDGGRFVSFVVVGNRTVSVLVTPRTQVVVSLQTVQFDPRDTGDDTKPFGGMFDDWAEL